MINGRDKPSQVWRRAVVGMTWYPRGYARGAGTVGVLTVPKVVRDDTRDGYRTVLPDLTRWFERAGYSRTKLEIVIT